MYYGKCFLCGEWGQLEEHHIFGGSNRKKSEKYGLKVGLCGVKCHREGKRSAHRCAETAQMLHEYGQKRFMNEQGASLSEFRAMFGKNYLEVPMKYRVIGETTVTVYLDVEAESEEEAIEAAYKEVSSLTAYCGNGGMDKLVGVSLSNASVDAGDCIEWKEAEVR